MSGMEPILIGAALGAGTSAITGGDPLTGALIGGATGGFGAGIGGAAGGGAGTFGGAALPAGSMTAAGGLTNAGASAFMSGGGAGAGMFGGMALPAGSMTAGGSLTDLGATTFMSGAPNSAAGPLSNLAKMDFSKLIDAGGEMGGQQQQPMLTPPPIRSGQPVNTQDPILALLEEQRRPQQRGRISLLDER